MTEANKTEPLAPLPSFGGVLPGALTAAATDVPQVGDPEFEKPASLRVAGSAAVLQGLLLFVGCVAVNGWAYLRLFHEGQSAGPIAKVVISLGGVGAFLGTVLLFGGFLLKSERFGGRILPMFYAWIVAPLMLGGIYALSLAMALRQNGNAMNTSIFWFNIVMAVGGVVFGIVIGWIVVTGPSARWFDSRRGVAAAPLAEGATASLCVPALLSLIFAFVPVPILMQIVSLILGLCALGIIRRSGGARWGTGMALTGVIVSLILLISAGTFTAARAVGMVLDDSARQDERNIAARLDEMGVAQQVYRQLSLAPDGKGGDCTSNLTDLLRATARLTPVQDCGELIGADKPTANDDAIAYHGYYFKLTTFADARPDDPNPAWVIFAWPAQWVGSPHAVLMLTPGETPVRLPKMTWEPPNNPTHDQVDLKY